MSTISIGLWVQGSHGHSHSHSAPAAEAKKDDSAVAEKKTDRATAEKKTDEAAAEKKTDKAVVEKEKKDAVDEQDSAGECPLTVQSEEVLLFKQKQASCLNRNTCQWTWMRISFFYL